MEEENNDISINSSKIDVANFFKNKFKLSDESMNKIINEDISGEILKYLEKADFDLLGIKVGPRKKIENYLKQNEDKFIPKQIEPKINSHSSFEEVKKFFEEYLLFQKNFNKIDGNELFNLTNEEIEKMGFNLGQKKKLINYIQYVKKIEKKTDIKITKESNEEEVNLFLKEQLNFSDNVISELALDGQSLLLLS